MNLNTTEGLVNKYMGKFGKFIFKASQISFSKTSSNTKYLWQKKNLVDGSYILIGGAKEPDKITINGTLFKSFHKLGGVNNFQILKDMAISKKPYPLILTDSFKSKREGLFVVTSIKEDLSIFDANGIPEKTEFTLELLKYEETKNFSK